MQIQRHPSKRLPQVRVNLEAAELVHDFFAFGGALETARWMRQVAAGAFDIDAKAARFVIQD